MTGPLAQQFAQVRECERYLWTPDLSTDQRRLNAQAFDAALSSIERHLQDMEKALASARKTLEVIEEPMHFDDLEAIADDRARMQAGARAWLRKDRAALPVSNGGPDGPAGAPHGQEHGPEKEEE